MSIEEFYATGVLVDFILVTVGTISYLFDSNERNTYEQNLNKINLSFDPLYSRLYSLENFKHTPFRFIWWTALNYFGCQLSWISVVYRLKCFLKMRELRSLMSIENRKAQILLRRDSTLSKEDVKKLFLESEPIIVEKVRDAVNSQ